MLVDLKNEIIEILNKEKKRINHEKIKIDLITDNEETYYLILEKEKYLLSIVIGDPVCAPYKNISILIYRVEDEAMVLSYYDNEDTSIQKNKEKIKEVLDYFINI